MTNQGSNTQARELIAPSWFSSQLNGEGRVEGYKPSCWAHPMCGTDFRGPQRRPSTLLTQASVLRLTIPRGIYVLF